MLVLLFLFVHCTFATHITVLLSGAKNKQEYIDALKYAFNRYILPQDIITAYTFSGHSLLKSVPANERDKIFSTLDHIEIDTKCSDWYSAFLNVDLSSPSRIIYMITDENPCGKDPTPVARQLEKEGFQIYTIGIGKGVDREWLKRIASQNGDYKWIQRFHYTTALNDRKRMMYTGRSVESPISTGEIVVASIVGALIVIIIIISCVFACRPQNKKR